MYMKLRNIISEHVLLFLNVFEFVLNLFCNCVACFYYFAVSIFGKNGSWQANFGSPPYAISSGNADADGHGNFEYAVPSGYFALCSKNLAEYG